ncbi:uncharacterized protein LOC107884957 isoform X2 [Acyrthosiphon pisum]|uniref:Uncharacterized protein n=1 Tax=Acyrthosiphon pisum TaxID=7029 RepID=A0A8R2D6F2_ACYPI|nr:uncharacterized protein LOC107884957 isoform X2 [Acyrthosiphon pisum]|eukprot:XP_016663612.1 PREDICTED: uncharacterized protein LOC107884957 isoform X2 [Acyrthosiphon pisum]
MFIKNFSEYNNCDLPSTSTLIPAVQFMEIADSGNLEYNNCDLPSTSTSIPAVQFMEIADSEISECNTTPIEEMSSFSGINDLDISDITYHKLETTIESINR